MNMKIIAILALYFLVGCATKIVYPQKFYSSDLNEKQRSTIINFYETGKGFYFVDAVDDNKVGNKLYGSSIIYELHVTPGNHVIYYTFTIKGEPVDLYSIRRYVPVSCVTKAGKYYTIEPIRDIEEIQKDRNFKDEKFSCVEQESKPINPYVNNKTVSDKYFENEK